MGAEDLQAQIPPPEEQAEAQQGTPSSQGDQEGVVDLTPPYDSSNYGRKIPVTEHPLNDESNQTDSNSTERGQSNDGSLEDQQVSDISGEKLDTTTDSLQAKGEKDAIDVETVSRKANELLGSAREKLGRTGSYGEDGDRLDFNEKDSNYGNTLDHYVKGVSENIPYESFSLSRAEDGTITVTKVIRRKIGSFADVKVMVRGDKITGVIRENASEGEPMSTHNLSPDHCERTLEVVFDDLERAIGSHSPEAKLAVDKKVAEVLRIAPEEFRN